MKTLATKALRATDPLRREARSVVQLVEVGFPASDHGIDRMRALPVPYCDYSGGYGLGFFQAHSIPYHVF